MSVAVYRCVGGDNVRIGVSWRGWNKDVWQKLSFGKAETCTCEGWVVQRVAGERNKGRSLLASQFHTLIPYEKTYATALADSFRGLNGLVAHVVDA